MRKKAFTLIELLVVISIIAHLLSILMPGLRLTKAKNLLCSTNLKEIVTAWHMYSGDYRKKLASAETRHSPPDPADTIKKHWVWGPTDVETGIPISYSVGSFEPTQAERGQGFKRGVLWPDLETVDVFHCQSDKSQGEIVLLEENDWRGWYRRCQMDAKGLDAFQRRAEYHVSTTACIFLRKLVIF